MDLMFNCNFFVLLIFKTTNHKIYLYIYRIIIINNNKFEIYLFNCLFI